MTGAHAVTTSAKAAGRVALDARRAGRAYGSGAAAQGEADSEGARQAERAVTRATHLHGKAASMGGRATSAAGARLATRAKKGEALALAASANAAKLGATDAANEYAKKAGRKAKAAKRAGRVVKAGAGVQRVAGKQGLSRAYRTVQRYGAGNHDATDLAGNAVKRASLKTGAAVGKTSAKGTVKLAAKGSRLAKRLAGSALRTIGSALASAVGSLGLPTLAVIGIVLVPVLAVALVMSSLSSMLSNAGAGGESDAKLLAAVAAELPEVSVEDAQTIAATLIETQYTEWDTEDERECLATLWEHESNWNYRAVNPTSGAYGIAQALPARKMESVGADWLENPATQIKWGMSYIKDRYGSPCAAWEFWQNPTEEPTDENWY